MLLVIVGGVGLACVKEGKGRCPPRSPLSALSAPPRHSSLRFYLFLSDVSVNVGVVLKKKPHHTPCAAIVSMRECVCVRSLCV